jgi:cold shock CspA family protein
MESARCPKHLVFQGRGFNHAGAGRAPGSCAYVSPATGEVLEIFAGKAVSVGSAYALLAIAGNPGMPAVQADHVLLNGQGPLRLGQVVLVAIDFNARGPRAKALWPTETKAVSRRPATVEKLGRITNVKAGFGFIRPFDASPDAFFHFSELRGFTPAEGMTVRYFPKPGQDGRPQAGDVRRS